jgi:4-hydroxy-tetrahydrodipicolinate synthase
MSELPHTVPATVTPFKKGGLELDPDWVPQHLAYLEKRGADGVLALGTNGEGPSLSQEERRQVIDAVLRARGGLRVFVGTGCASLTDTIAISRYALDKGADAVMVVPPFYFKEPAPEGLIAYYDAVFRALPREGKVILYNIPSYSGVEIVDGLVDALAERYAEQLLGIKDTSGDLRRRATTSSAIPSSPCSTAATATSARPTGRAPWAPSPPRPTSSRTWWRPSAGPTGRAATSPRPSRG